MEQKLKDAFDMLEAAALKQAAGDPDAIKMVKAGFTIFKDFYVNLSWFLAKK